MIMGDGGNAGASELAIEVVGLSFMYAGSEVPALRDLSWRVPEGAFALLVGGTGSGKSTLLSLLKPEIAPAGARQGAVRILGRPIGSIDPAESARDIGYVFQSPDNQLVCESVWHEMAFGLENLGTPQAEMRRLVAETSYFFGMESWFREDVDALSGGRKQLLALASTLVMQPRLLLLDEPTAQLDPIAEKNFLHALFRVNRELGCTVVVATHRPRAMVDYATCAFKLVDGALLRISDVDTLRAAGVLGVSGTPDGEVFPEPARESHGLFSFWHSEVAETSLEGGIDGSRGASKPGGGVKRGVAPFPVGSGPVLVGGGVPETEVNAQDRGPGKKKRDEKRSASAGVTLELRRAWFRYGREAPWVLRNLDLSVRGGRIHALVGGNGCGKSTLLSIMAGTRRLQQGKLACATRSRALLPQDPRALFAEETVDAELMEWASAGGYGPREAQGMLDELGLSACSALSSYDLSGGQQQLLALGKLMLMRPRLLLLDEPTKGLDLPSRRIVASRLRAMADAGATVVMASHDLELVSQLADDVSMVFDGDIACTCPREEFFHGNVYYHP